MKARLRRAAACSRDFCSGSLRLRAAAAVLTACGRPTAGKPNAASTAGSAPQTRNANAVDDAVRSDGAVGSAGTDAAAVSKKQPVELQVFIAASLSPAMQEIAQHYMESNPDVKITFNADSSGKLQTSRHRSRKGMTAICFSPRGRSKWTRLNRRASSKTKRA